MSEGGAFRRELSRRASDPAGRTWVYVSYDQLTDEIGPLSRLDPSDAGVVLVESAWKPARRPYHKQKLALILANQRHFALEQAARGVAVRYRATRSPYSVALREEAREMGPLSLMEPAERELRADLASLVADSLLTVEPHEGWITSSEDFEASQKPHPPWRMDAFYRHVRRETGLLMADGRPEGGKYSHDVENRRPWRGEPEAPEALQFPVDPVKAEVAEFVESRFASHPGSLRPAALPATRSDAEMLWARALRECLPWFGPFEDAMSLQARDLFHTRISFLLHVHRLLPRRVVADVAASNAPLASREGFVRQVLGWREFMRHVHVRTDGFRDLPGSDSADDRATDAPAAPSVLRAEEPLPPAFWGTTSGLHCLDSVVCSVLETGYSHHITRLMVLSNLATLIAVSPRELTDWFWVMYTDAFDWVVEPNVLGMGTFGAGDLMTTKPYVSGAAYINRMSDYCSGCAFDPRDDCPITSFYWAFLERNEDRLRDNPRMHLPLASMRKRGEDQRKKDRVVTEWAKAELQGGRRLRPADRPVSSG
ncbi:MAG: cryptochrome/photolyase family protein [marine benthic group bacterium]|nr:cryptochrome/photolyase family protein [Gemmatimonadota bacterium]